MIVGCQKKTDVRLSVQSAMIGMIVARSTRFKE